ncbi:hypothetical protein BDK51DRAFT_33532 [Blyttiomyces helicus]|uniref:WDR19 WD40 repeat domain-containing protein n=1 Tax=Blyttiomyces helicus TaxID=388810 RepID=A0A4P9VTC7_9FUNG|nr:hypothetical protein BDK51DRAFT_33532 [Blyttiomyces helicus]|eukprot:RKO82764.1 hypothetical protein BDK51DRAFT_33532 [Blyttiomyces helicus]
MLHKLRWSDDGQFLSVSTKEGALYTYLAKIPTLGAASGSCVAYLTNLKEVTISDQGKLSSAAHSATSTRTIQRELEVEPTFVALSSTHMGVTLNNRGWFYAIADELAAAGTGTGAERKNAHSAAIVKVDDHTSIFRTSPSPNQDYPATVRSLSLTTGYAAAVLSDGRLQVHAIERPSGRSEPVQRIFPEKDAMTRNAGAGAGADSKKAPSPFTITCAALTPEMVVYGTANGVVQHYVLEEWAMVNDLRHKVGG